MGDRANVCVKGSGTVYLYTHGDGTKLPETVREALQRHERWEDSLYLARIIFCQMVKGKETESTGFGIGGEIIDGRNRVLTVDVPNNEVVYPNGDKFSFEEFCSEPQKWPL